MKEVRPSTLIISARNHLEGVQKILKQINEGSIASEVHHSSVRGSSLTGVPKLELGHHKTLSLSLDSNTNATSLDAKKKVLAYELRHRQQHDATEWERIALFQQRGLPRPESNSSLTRTGIRACKTDTSSNFVSPRKKTRNHRRSSTDNGSMSNRMAQCKEKQDFTYKNSNSNTSCLLKNFESSQSNLNMTREGLNYPCRQERSELVQLLRRLPSRSEETSSSDITSKFGNDDVSRPSILRRTKSSVSHNIRLGRRVSFIEDLSASCPDNTWKADESGHILPNQ